MIESLVFVRPWWLLGLLPAIGLAFAWARRRMSASHWESSIDPDLLGALLEPGSRGGFRNLAWLAALGLAIATLGLAGPAWQKLPQPVEERRDALVIVLDLSLSMMAEDVRPSRLVRARQKIADVLRARREGYTALVAYAGDAHTVAPLTDDTRTIENLLAALSPEMMPVLGSNLESALEVTGRLLENSKVDQGRVLLVTDAVDDPADANTLCQRNFPLSILGVGTDRGATIPLDFVNQPGQVLRTQAGDPITARLDDDRLAEIAARCHGRYRRLEVGDGDVAYLLATPLPGEDLTEEVDREFDTWADMGYLAALALLPLLLVSFRRGLLAAGLVLMVCLPLPADASLWDDLWRRPDQQGFEALREGAPDVAAERFEDPEWKASSEYRAGDYPAAAARYRNLPVPRATYNLGNALARAGDYQGALDAYDTVLGELPDHDDARFNRELVQRLLDEQRAEDQESESEGEEGGNPDQQNPYGQPDDGEQQRESGDGMPPEQPPEQNPEQQDESNADDSQSSESEQGESPRDEQQDAMEQWLRRVPDDPGGLLRRKFQYETNQRLRRGDYRSRTPEKIW